MYTLPRPAFRIPAGISATLIAVAAGCSQPTEPSGQATQLTSLPRALSAAEKSVLDASNHFALTLFERTSAAAPGGNVFISPLSVSMSLGMVLNGAAGETRAQMQRTLGFGEAELADVQSGYRDLSALLRGLDRTTSFEIANSIWYKLEYPILPGFLEAGRTYFDAEIRGVNFGDAEGTKAAVNKWVNDKTHGRIPTILEEVHRDDVMYLINAIWFKGSWRSRFDPADTRDAQFTSADGSTQMVPMMSQEADSSAGFRHYADASVEAGELPYGNGAFAMTILMPPPGTHIDAFTASLTADRWNAVVAGLQDKPGFVVQLPRFTLSYGRELKEDLQALGMTEAFDPHRANLSGMTAQDDLYVGFVMHKTFVKVDEEGTEAAAVTNSGIRQTSMPPTFRVDRPFVFAIRERLSGTVLFIGKMARVP